MYVALVNFLKNDQIIQSNILVDIEEVETKFPLRIMYSQPKNF